MIETCEIYSVDLCGSDPGVRNALQKKYGSRKSGTIYIIAKGQDEANAVAQELFTRNGHVPPAKLRAYRSDHIKQALRMIL